MVLQLPPSSAIRCINQNLVIIHQIIFAAAVGGEDAKHFWFARSVIHPCAVFSLSNDSVLIDCTFTILAAAVRDEDVRHILFVNG